MKISWFLALLGAVLLITLLVLLELGVLKSPFATQIAPMAPQESAVAATTTPPPSPTPVANKKTQAPTPVKLVKDPRQETVYKLSQQGLVAKNELAQIVKAPIPAYEHLDDPHSAGSLQHKSELAVRVAALEALDNLAVENPQEIQKILEDIAPTQTEPALKFMVRISLEGIYQKRPGKLKRTIDAMIHEKEEL